MDYAYMDNGQRARILRTVRRVVVKVGTRLLTDMEGWSKAERVSQLVDAIAQLREQGLEVILVSSGAIGAGMTVLETAKRPRTVRGLQAHAAVGQSRLMYLYETACVARGFHCAQLLLTADDVKDHGRHLNVTSCLDELLSRGVLPIINENDSVSVEELKFGDNDLLAALVATMTRAELTVLLTTVDGMYNPGVEEGRKRLSVVRELTDEVLAMADGTDDNHFSVGGMLTKLQAAEVVTHAGEALWIADGRDFSMLDRVFEGQDTGTLFPPCRDVRMRASKRYLAFFAQPAGELTIDAGAAHALCKEGRSLLPGGVCAQSGGFTRGDTVRILNPEGEEIARGVTNYSAEDVQRILGVRSERIEKILGADASFAEIVHRDYLVVLR